MKGFVLLIAAGSFFLVACKKERTCTCSVNASGTKTVHNRSDATSATITIPFPGIPALPPIQITPARDETTSYPYNFDSKYTTTYSKIRKSHVKKLCQGSFSETIFENSSQVVPGSYTLTITDQGLKRHNCVID